MVSADECGRSLRGMAALLNRKEEGVAAFDTSEAGFWRSFAAIGLTLPAYIVALGLERHRLGLDITGAALFADPSLAFRVAVAQVASFVAMPLAMIAVARRFGLGAGYVPYVVVSNWVGVFGSFMLSLPGLLFLMGFETAPLTGLFTLAFAAILLHLNWFTAKVTLGIGAGAAAAITALSLGLDLAIEAGIGTLAG
jgi:hypothetical protein